MAPMAAPSPTASQPRPPSRLYRSVPQLLSVQIAFTICQYCVIYNVVTQHLHLLPPQPTEGVANTVITISGSGLLPHGVDTGDAITTATVWIDHTPCTGVMAGDTLSSDDEIQCTVQDYEAGHYHVDVLIADKGYAAVSPSSLVPGPLRNASLSSPSLSSIYPTFLLLPSVVSVAPETGSLVGGAVVTITGSGFSPIAERMNVLLGDQVCDIIRSTHSEITCVTSDGGEGGEVEVMVTVNGLQANSSVTYTYDAVATPTISAVTMEITAGISTIEITGENFGTTSASVQILNSMEEWLYGSMTSLCTVSSFSSTTITCELSPKPAGSYVAVVHISGQGLAMETSPSSSAIQYDLTLNSFSPAMSGNGGGVEITVTGTGFPETSDDDTEEDGQSLSVSFCSTECRVSSSTPTELTCTLDPPDPSDASTACNTASVSYNGLTETVAETFEFRADITPTVSSISPLLGGTAGGTIVTVTGSHFFPQDISDGADLTEEDLVVTIDGAACVWYGRTVIPTETSLECHTSEHRTTLRAEVKVFVRTRSFALPDSSSPSLLFEYIDLWSSPFTWGGEGLPRKGDSVVIQEGQTVFLDTDTPVLNLVLIEGALVFEDKQDLHLQAKYIFINTGRLQVGT